MSAFFNLSDETYVDSNQAELEAISLKDKRKAVMLGFLSVINGSLYFTISEAGGGNIKRLFHADGETIDHIIFVASIGSSLVYTMFCYKTLESLSLRIGAANQLVFSFMAPFAASAFFTAGVEGSEILGFGKDIAISIGATLFSFRILSCIDSSIKFPGRLTETKESLVDAWIRKDFIELARLSVIIFMSIGYAASVTDSIYSAATTIMQWINVGEKTSSIFGYSSAFIGAIGTLPLLVYWGHRGLRQLTFGGKYDAFNNTNDPTDKYTYVGLLLVSPAMLGVLGSATVSTGKVFGRLGLFAEVIRIISSILYTAFAGTPGMATLLRNLFGSINCLNKIDSEESMNLLPGRLIVNEDNNSEIVSEEVKAKQSCISVVSFFSKESSKDNQNKFSRKSMCNIL